MKAKDIMKTEVITVAAEMTLREVSKLFIDSGISGAPVVDHRGHMIGVVSQTDVVRSDRESRVETETAHYYRQPDGSDLPKGFQLENPDMTRVRDIMTPVVLSADAEAPVEELAVYMLERHIHRVVIMRDKKPVGIVTTMDMLKTMVRKPVVAGPLRHKR